MAGFSALPVASVSRGAPFSLRYLKERAEVMGVKIRFKRYGSIRRILAVLLLLIFPALASPSAFTGVEVPGGEKLLFNNEELLLWKTAQLAALHHTGTSCWWVEPYRLTGNSMEHAKALRLAMQARGWRFLEEDAGKEVPGLEVWRIRREHWDILVVILHSPAEGGYLAFCAL